MSEFQQAPPPRWCNIVAQCLLYLIQSQVDGRRSAGLFNQLLRIRFVILVLGGLCLGLRASAMDRWAALSMLESGDDDHAVGPGGEISRFQIRRELWPGGNPQDAHDALSAAQEIMQSRLDEFQHTHKRPATDFEFYVLWNAPWQQDHPSTAVTERARRFSNLVRR